MLNRFIPAPTSIESICIAVAFLPFRISSRGSRDKSFCVDLLRWILFLFYIGIDFTASMSTSIEVVMTNENDRNKAST